MDSTASPERTNRAIDHSAPFKGIVVCCTSIPTEGRTVIGKRVDELGGIHKYDLTPEVTHLIVGDYDTPKYRHVARERPDIKAMDASWIVAVAELWRNGEDDFDFEALEAQHQLKPFDRSGSMPEALAGDGSPRQGLLISLTGFGESRDAIAAKITANGARYTPDLTKQCTHLIVHQPEGKKFTAAKNWGVITVSQQWLDLSVERGLILEESKFDPLLSLEDQGVGAWLKRDARSASLGKRSRSGAGPGEEAKGPRKLRKTASMKLNSQRDGLWGDILKRSDSKADSMAEDSSKSLQVKESTPGAVNPPAEPRRVAPPQPQGIFANALFYIQGFPKERTQILDQTITSLAGSTAPSLDALAVPTLRSEYPSRFLIVPQNSQPDTHPQLPDERIDIVTEFYVEKCLHNKQFFDPRAHVIGRPFPCFPIPDLSSMIVCTAAFTGIELSQVARSVNQLGATFAEEFRPTTSVLICRSLSATRKEKLKCALAWGVTVVSAEWLWECISTGCRVPPEDFTFTELKKRRSLAGASDAKQISASKSKGPENASKHCSPPSLPPTAPVSESTSKPSRGVAVDRSGFDKDDTTDNTKEMAQTKNLVRPTKHDSTTSADFHTARTTLLQTNDTDSTLTELSSASLNKSPSPPKRSANANTLRTKSDPTPQHEPENPASARAPSAPPADHATKAASKATEADEATEEDIRQARERQTLLTSRLATLVDTTTASFGGSPAALHASADELKPRRRQLLGRATSNVSATSSNANTPVPAPLSDAGAFGGNENSEEAGTEDQGSAGEDNRPSTQLAYGDPEAQGVKAQIMSRMAGENLRGKGKAGGARAGQLSAAAVGGRNLRKK